MRGTVVAMKVRLTLHLVPGIFAVCRLLPNAPVPEWAAGVVVSVTRTSEELSVVCEEKYVPTGIQRQADFRCLKVAGPLAFEMTGVMAALAGPLADAGISLFPMATYDTDYLFVRSDEMKRAVAALRGVGHRVLE
jgi:hypothetical protein